MVLTPILRESYILHASTILGISPTLFGSKIENVKPKLATPKEDIAQLSILKTLLENKELIDTMLEVIEPFIKKSFLIRKIKMDILPRLKRGELVYFDKNI